MCVGLQCMCNDDCKGWGTKNVQPPIQQPPTQTLIFKKVRYG